MRAVKDILIDVLVQMLLRYVYCTLIDLEYIFIAKISFISAYALEPCVSLHFPREDNQIRVHSFIAKNITIFNIRFYVSDYSIRSKLFH